jgi:hypothetical protein
MLGIQVRKNLPAQTGANHLFQPLKFHNQKSDIRDQTLHFTCYQNQLLPRQSPVTLAGKYVTGIDLLSFRP